VLHKAVAALPVGQFEARTLVLLYEIACAGLAKKRQAGAPAPAAPVAEPDGLTPGVDILLRIVQAGSGLPKELHEDAVHFLLRCCRATGGGELQRLALLKAARSGLLEGSNIEVSLMVLKCLLESAEELGSGAAAALATELELLKAIFVELGRLCSDLELDIERRGWYTLEQGLRHRMDFLWLLFDQLQPCLEPEQVEQLWRLVVATQHSEQFQNMVFTVLLRLEAGSPHTWHSIAEPFFGWMSSSKKGQGRLDLARMKRQAFHFFVNCQKSAIDAGCSVESVERGLTALWYMALEAEDDQVASDAVGCVCLNGLQRKRAHSRPQNSGGSGDNRDEFILHCMAQLQKAVAGKDHRVILQCLRLLTCYSTALLDQLRSAGVVVRSHQGSGGGGMPLTINIKGSGM
ncbi:unnamed protein product, partial [Chrysoparadoxa australica]